MNRKTKTSEMKVDEQLETKKYPSGPEEYIEERGNIVTGKPELNPLKKKRILNFQ